MKINYAFLWIACAAGVAALGWLVWGPPVIESPSPVTTRDRPRNTQAEPPAEVRNFCGNCHVFPDPSYFPQEAWFTEVQRGFNFYVQSERTDLVEPKLDEVVQWFRASAPEKFQLPGLLPTARSGVKFEKSIIPLDSKEMPLVSGMAFVHAETGPWPQLQLCDMSSGHVCGVSHGASGPQTETLLKSGFPACSRVADIDGDGVRDLLIGDLGSRLPADHQLGRVLFLSGTAPDTPVTLIGEIGRVADITPADFDGDLDLDLVVAEFGWLKTGGIWLLENIHASEPSSTPLSSASFRPHKIDSRHGTIHVPVTDINLDGQLDFIALVSQEHEVVEAFINEGQLKFRREKVSVPMDPSSGSSGIEMTDIDQDGDIDFVYSNGDTLDSHLIKPYHGVRLLMNEGRFPFREVSLIKLPGACDTASGDFDGDGDLDIAVCSYLPERIVPQLATGTYDVVFWLEQTGTLEFVPHPIEVSSIGHLAISTGDFDTDGRIDLATGNASGTEWGAIWWNRQRPNLTEAGTEGE